MNKHEQRTGTNGAEKACESLPDTFVEEWEVTDENSPLPEIPADELWEYIKQPADEEKGFIGDSIAVWANRIVRDIYHVNKPAKEKCACVYETEAGKAYVSVACPLHTKPGGQRDPGGSGK